MLSERISIERFEELVEEALESKPNKQTVANALHRKANKLEIEALVAEKADIHNS